jgi:hypothetical protein
MRFTLHRLSLITILLLFSGNVSAQKLDKPFTEWSKDAAQGLLNDSPWAKTYQSTAGAAAADAQNSAREQADNVFTSGQRGRSARSGGPPPVVIRLHSALPIRQAIIRLNQISSGYEKMSQTQKQEFDSNAKKFLECAVCQDYYVVTITQFPGSSTESVEEGIFQSLKREDFIGNVWLANDKGETRQLAQFIPPKGKGEAAVFFFPRKDEKGNLLITPESKELRFVFKTDFLNSPNNRFAYLVPRFFEFKVSKMVVGQEVMF